jgi:hypothetical protein
MDLVEVFLVAWLALSVLALVLIVPRPRKRRRH